jgi:hypothetical protein
MEQRPGRRQHDRSSDEHDPEIHGGEQTSVR